MAYSKKKSMGSYAYLIGLALAVILSVMGAGLGEFAAYATALVAVLGLVVILLNVKAAEGQKFLLWIVAAGVTGFLAIQGVFSGIGLQIIEQVISGIAVFFGSAALMGVIVQGHKLLSK